MSKSETASSFEKLYPGKPVGPNLSAMAKDGDDVRVYQGFKAAIKLLTDQKYRDEATVNPLKLLDDCSLSLEELETLRDAAVLSGVPHSAIDDLFVNLRLGSFSKPGVPSKGTNSCCCCCCCGQAGATVVFES